MNSTATATTADTVNAFHRALHQWYRTYGRTDLPWRHTHDAYAIYISEIMLQQTQVATVLQRFYHPFLMRFPTLQALADAPLEDVLHAWQGLGYYTRAANLHKAAQLAAPTLPRDAESLMALPGIGRNTAHAIAAFAFGAKVPVMEANLRRVLHRIFAREKASDAELWDMAFSLLDEQQSFDYNQAMMDLGAMICTPRNPRCGDCPAANICQGKDSPERFPTPKAKAKTPTRKTRTLICMDASGKLYARPRTTRLLGGLYEFPSADIASDSVTFGNETYFFEQATPLGRARQVYSHFTLETDVFLLSLPRSMRGTHWHQRPHFAKLAISGLESKILALLDAFSEDKVLPRSKKAGKKCKK